MVFEGGSDGRWCLKEAAMVWQGSSEQRRRIRELTCSGGRQTADGGGQTTARHPPSLWSHCTSSSMLSCGVALLDPADDEGDSEDDKDNDLPPTTSQSLP